MSAEASFTNQALLEALGLTHLRVTRIDIKARPAQHPLVTVEAFAPESLVNTLQQSFRLVPITPTLDGGSDGDS